MPPCCPLVCAVGLSTSVAWLLLLLLTCGNNHQVCALEGALQLSVAHIGRHLQALQCTQQVKL